MSRMQDHPALCELLGALCNDCLTREQHAQLEAQLEADADARRLYLDYLDVHLGLRNLHLGVDLMTAVPDKASPHHDGPCAPGTDFPRDCVSPDDIPVTGPAAASHRTGNNLFCLLAVAALTAVFVLGLQWLTRWLPLVRHQHGLPPLTNLAGCSAEQNSEDNAGSGAARRSVPQYVATLLKSANCEWGGDHRPQFDGQRLLSRDLRLESGLAELGFASGVRIVLQGPAHLSIESSTHAYLQNGRLVLRGHETATPFLLRTPHSTLEDIGTEYGAEVSNAGVTEVHVFSGEVQIRPRDRKTGDAVRKRLYQGQAVAIGDQHINDTPLNTTRFVREIPAATLPQMDRVNPLLAWEYFDYRTSTLGAAEGGGGFAGPWRAAIHQQKPARSIITAAGSLTRIAGEPTIGKAVELVADGRSCARTLSSPIRLDIDAIYYISYLLQRMKDAAPGKSQYVGLSLRTASFRSDRLKLHFGMTSESYIAMTHGNQQATVAPQLATRETYLFVAKIVAGRDAPDQLMLRVFGPDESVGEDSPLIWNCVAPAHFDNTVFDQLLLHCAPAGHYQIDSIRIGRTWQSVTAPTRPDISRGPQIRARYH